MGGALELEFADMTSGATRRLAGRRVVVIAADAGSLAGFRAPLLSHLVHLGHEVIALAPATSPELAARIESMGVALMTSRLHRTGVNPLADVASYIHLRRLLGRLGPDVVLAYNVKPVIFGTLAAKAVQVPRRVAMLTGLGHAFVAPGVRGRGLRRLVSGLLRLGLGAAHHLVLHNPDDAEELLRRGALPRKLEIAVVGGSGVSLTEFSEVPVPDGPPRFLFVGRMLREKGVVEFLEAAAMVRASYPDARFELLGPLDSNPSGLSEADILALTERAGATWLGSAQDVRPHLARCSVFVLPSYREGLSRAALEAMAVGRPLITTDAPGCRQLVETGANGVCVPVGDARALADAMERYIAEPASAKRHGERSRQLAHQKYDVRRVNNAMVAALNLAEFLSNDERT